MDREALFALLLLLLVGPTCCVAAAATPLPRGSSKSARRLERALWARIWFPLLPSGLMVAALLGWAVQEPDSAERLRPATWVPVCLFGIVWARAVIRAGWATAARGHVRIGARGFLRPRIVVDGTLQLELDPAAYEAAIAHERAHCAHRDPLRIWCAQAASDLQWPIPGARARLDAWLHALELARDEEARESGTDGADLAAAIVHVARAPTPFATAIAGLTGRDAHALRERIARLLQPLRRDPGRRHRPLALAAWTLAAGTAAVLGSTFGEPLVHLLALR